MIRTVLLTAHAEDSGKSLESFLTRRLCVSHGLLVSLKATNGILVNGEPRYTNTKLSEGDAVSVMISEHEDPEESKLIPQDLNVGILYEDDDYLILSKPAGMAVHPSYCHPDGTLANHFLFLHPDCICRTVTRLDAGTSGCTLIAKNMLSASVNRNNLTRIYYGITDRPVGFSRTIVNAPIERETQGSRKRMVREDGKQSVTHIAKVWTKNGFSLLRFRLETGRTHQIRVHCAYLGIPLCGDELYGGTMDRISRPALHAAYLSLLNPITKCRIAAKAPIPKDMELLIN